MAEQKFTTSFIPKKPIQTVGSGGRIKRRGGMGIFTLIATLIFVVGVAATAGAYLYKFKLEGDIERQNANLADATKELDQNFISQAVRLNDRLNGVQTLLDNHLSPSQIFFLLEEKTVETVKFESLDFSFDVDGDLMLSGVGLAVDFESIIQQSDEYGKRGHLRDVIFSNLQNEERGLVSFDFESKVDPDIILYSNALPEEGGERFIPSIDTDEELNDDSATNNEGENLNQETNPETTENQNEPENATSTTENQDLINNTQ